MTDRELLEQALEALEAALPNPQASYDGLMSHSKVITALRERLAQPEQELGFAESLANRALPRREWVGLTEDEIDECYYWKDRQWTTDELVRHVEAKLKEKNV